MNIGEVRRGYRSGASGTPDAASTGEVRPGKIARDTYASAVPRPAPSLWERVKGWASGAATWLHNVFDHEDRWTNPAARPPATPGKLSVLSYNILLGGKYLEQVEHELRDLDADVVALQEANLASVRHLAEKLGYHYAFASTAGHVAGKAILSRYPIESFADRPIHEVPLWKRIGAYWQVSASQGDWEKVEPLYQRSALRATLSVGGRKVDVLDTHLALGHAGSNAAQLRVLTDLAKQSVSKGHSVVVAGDFNTNFALAGKGEADPAGRFATPTDTVQEFLDRYPRSVVGNIATPEDKAAVDALLGVLDNSWDAAAERRIRRGDDASDPAAALAALGAGQAAPGSAAFDRLMNAADGVSHQGANKRFDNVLVSPDIQVERASIDHGATGSDHSPVLAVLSWR
ncbi:MAG: endonuclease/exonuclease/phosphatase family protein [Candidatus Sericytochromatia bacterium]|nr:endonuclease/exonuclease/phosphatase family protein [Candidatus Tanganyikabacteria bacterium]